MAEFLHRTVAGLKRWEVQGTTSELAQHADAICEHLVAHPPDTIAAAQAAIEQLTGVRRSQTQVRQFLRRLGFKRLKTGSLPAKADPEAQAKFKKSA